MTQNALLFIPDISGFTEFVHNTAINHSQHIISELLEVLIDKNNADFELAEVEGDALFFYKIQETTDLKWLEKQMKEMYIAFHSHLKRYEYERICQCGACSSAYNLDLKFIVHFGNIDFLKVKDKSKPYGSTVIQVHRLLKNDIPYSEYMLITKAVVNTSETTNLISKWDEAKEAYDFGEINYYYFPISEYKKELPYVPPIPENIPKHKIYEYEKIIETPILDLYEVISNFDYRLLWNKGIKRLDYEERKVNRSGIKHQCLINKNQKLNQITSRKETKEGQLVYGETTNDVLFVKKFSVFYVLEEIKEGYTKLNVEVFADFNIFGFLIKPILVINLRKITPQNIKELILLINSGFKIEQ